MDSSTFTTIAPLIFIMAIMYFLLIRPQQQQAKKLRE
jgi:preprotein translocase YajC subunit